jgi:hemerythrin-like domain-containing protein
MRLTYVISGSATDADNPPMMPLRECEKHEIRARAIVALRSEHDSLRTVVALLDRLLRDIAALNSEPDFALLSSAVYYMNEFPERVHHPKEQEHIFSRVRARTSAFNRLLDRLQIEHALSRDLAASIERAIVRYQGGAPEGLQKMQAAVGAYSSLISGHMRSEEELLESAQDYLPQSDWQAIALAFETDMDPLSPQSARTEFQRLQARITNMLPAKCAYLPTNEHQDHHRR